jgi:hypothetical protein
LKQSWLGTGPAYEDSLSVFVLLLS